MTIPYKYITLILLLTLGLATPPARAEAIPTPQATEAPVLLEPHELIPTMAQLALEPAESLTIVEPPKPVVSKPSYSGNTYDVGYCTWYVKNQLSWVQNGWGNASEWIQHTRSTSIPQVGMVAWKGGGYGHVAVVTGVGNGTVTISEANHKGWNIISSRTVPTGYFTYLY